MRGQKGTNVHNLFLNFKSDINELMFIKGPGMKMNNLIFFKN